MKACEMHYNKLISDGSNLVVDQLSDYFFEIQV